MDCLVEKINQRAATRETILRLEINCFENGSLIVRMNLENNSVEKPKDKPSKRKNRRMKSWQKREAMLKESPPLSY